MNEIVVFFALGEIAGIISTYSYIRHRFNLTPKELPVKATIKYKRNPEGTPSQSASQTAKERTAKSIARLIQNFGVKILLISRQRMSWRADYKRFALPETITQGGRLQ